MSGHRYDRVPSLDSHSQRRGQYRDDRDARMYNDHSSSPYSRDKNYHRSPPSQQHYLSHAHDRNRSTKRLRGDDFQIKGTSLENQRDMTPPRDPRDDRRSHHRGRLTSPKGHRTTSYRDRDREGYQSTSYDSRSRSQSGIRRRGRSRSRSRNQDQRRDRSPYYGAPPSREVILEGLKQDTVEEDFALKLETLAKQVIFISQIAKELKEYHNIENLEDVRVIRDRYTKASRGFGFLTFRTMEDSKAFVEHNHPIIYLYGKGPKDNDEQAAKVHIAYSREREERSRADKPESEWICKFCAFVNFPSRIKCHRCSAPQSDMAPLNAGAQPKPQYLNSGDSDVSPNGKPSQFLLIRGLEPTVTEDLLAKGVAKLYKPSRRHSPPVSLSSKKGNFKVASTTGDANLGAKEGSLRRVLLIRDRRNNESWRYGFAEFASIDDAQAAMTRYNSFEKFTISSKPVTADYVHAGVFVPYLIPTENSAQFTFTPLRNQATKLIYWDGDAWASELVVSTDSPKLVASDHKIRSAADEAAVAALSEGLVKPSKGSEARAKKRKAEASAAAKAKKAVPGQLQFWSDRHAELHGAQPATQAGEDLDHNTTSEFNKPAKVNGPRSQSFVDLEKKCCYLCSRQFKMESEVIKHERLSPLHRNNLNKEDLVSQAQAKLLQAGIVPVAVEESPEYRDRAKERRAAFGASKKISLPLKKQASKPDLKTKDDPTPTQSKGASWLGKMGWSAGEGLGAKGTGRTEVVTPEMYAKGVGLGAQGGKIGDAAGEADRMTKGNYSGFLEQTKAKAKERFEGMA